MENFFQEVIVGLPEIFIILIGYFFIVSIIKFFKFLTENDPVKKKIKRDSVFEYLTLFIFNSIILFLLNNGFNIEHMLVFIALIVILFYFIITKTKYLYLASSLFIFTITGTSMLLIVAFIGGATVDQKMTLIGSLMLLLVSRFFMSKLI